MDCNCSQGGNAATCECKTVAVKGRRKRIIQDGPRFYDDDSGQVVFTTPNRVKDFDLRAAQDARLQFERWANAVGLHYYFPCPKCDGDCGYWNMPLGCGK